MTSFALTKAPVAPAVGRSVLPRKPARINTLVRHGTPFDAGEVRSSLYACAVLMCQSSCCWSGSRPIVTLDITLDRGIACFAYERYQPAGERSGEGCKEEGGEGAIPTVGSATLRTGPLAVFRM